MGSGISEFELAIAVGREVAATKKYELRGIDGSPNGRVYIHPMVPEMSCMDGHLGQRQTKAVHECERAVGFPWRTNVLLSRPSLRIPTQYTSNTMHGHGHRLPQIHLNYTYTMLHSTVYRILQSSINVVATVLRGVIRFIR